MKLNIKRVDLKLYIDKYIICMLYIVSKYVKFIYIYIYIYIKYIYIYLKLVNLAGINR